MKHFFRLNLLLSTLLTPLASAGTTVYGTGNLRYSHGANTGWLNFRWSDSPTEGMSANPYFLSGAVYAAATGWINLGDGSPSNGIRYSNKGQDFGVNLQDDLSLTGYAYAPAIGWINFGPNDASRWNNAPRVNIRNGLLYGYAWSPSIGWINLQPNASEAIYVKTNFSAIVDTDADGLPDAWERIHATEAGHTNNLLSIYSDSSDSDNDGISDLEEYALGSSPNNSESSISSEVEMVSTSSTSFSVQWPTQPNRLYTLYESEDLATWTRRGALRRSGTGNTMSQSVNYDSTSNPNLFWRVTIEPAL